MPKPSRANNQPLGASFRDPSGFVFVQKDVLYRQINQSYRQDYDRLMSSGLYAELAEAGLLISHKEARVKPVDPSLAYKVIQPEAVQFISYPYEWAFSQLQDAALATLAIQKRALSKGMSLKDSSAYNIQFHAGHPILIDTLSFETYQEGQPWVAYRQFCQHFLAPLALMAHRDIRLSQLLRVYIDGLPLDLASRLLPAGTRWNVGLSMHIHLHARLQRRYAGRAISQVEQSGSMSRIAMQGLLDSLESIVRSLRWKPAGTEWGSYYAESADHYSQDSFRHKGEILETYLKRISPQRVWDLGANTGLFSRVASRRGIFTVAFDLDPAAVEQNYRTCKAGNETNLLPLVLDLTNPSPALGWSGTERLSLLERGPAEAVLALALIHHLAIANNVPLVHLAAFFRQAGRWLVVEFVPKSDSQVQTLLASREDIFPDYSVGGFEAAFKKHFVIRQAEPIRETQRVLYLMESR